MVQHVRSRHRLGSSSFRLDMPILTLTNQILTLSLGELLLTLHTATVGH
jgi:hypothetical protein